MLDANQRATFVRLFEYWFQGNRNAMMLGVLLLDVAHVWDDLIDRDKDVLEDEAIHGAFCALLLDLPRNAFWQEHWPALHGALESSYLMWRAANVLEKGSADDTHKAFVLRAGIYQIFALIAGIVGGREWACQMAPEIWRSYGERLSDFMEKGDA